MKYIFVLLALMLGNVIVAEQKLLQPYGGTTEEFKNLEWNRYVVDNFVILSIDNNQGKWLSENMDKIKTWCMIRWGFPDAKFSKECRVFCVPNRDLLKRLFGLEESKIEIRKDLTVIWMVLDDKPARSIPVYLTPICYSDFEATRKVTLGWWFKCGSAQLNGSIADVRQSLTLLGEKLKKDQPQYLSEKIFSMTEEEYNKESAQNRREFDRQSLAMCLLLRKEFGEAKMQGFLRISNRNNAQDVLKVVYGFSGYAHFDKQYIRYMRDLTSDVTDNKTPDSYLDIMPVNR